MSNPFANYFASSNQQIRLGKLQPTFDIPLMQSNEDDKPDSKSDPEPYWRALDNKTDNEPSGRFSNFAAKFDFNTVKKSEADDDVEVLISSEDFEFIQKKMQDEFYVSPKDVIHDALFYLQQSDDEQRKKLEERNAKNPPDPSVAEFFEKAKADGTLGTPEFNKEFNRRFCDRDDLYTKLSDGAEPEY